MPGPLTPRQKRLLVLFKVAIAHEREAQTMYAEMAEHCDDAELAEVIASLRASEQTHEETLLDQYAALKRTSGFKE